MESHDLAPLDIGEFKCVSVTRSGVVVVYEPTNRRYVYGWKGGELGLASPSIHGKPGPHAPEVLDCLARAVAHKAARDTPRHRRPVSSFWHALPRASQLRSLLPTR